MEPKAEWANPERGLVAYTDSYGLLHVVLPDDPRLNGLLIGAYQRPGGMRVPASVTRFQAFYVMRNVMRDNGKSLYTEALELLQKAAEDAAVLPEDHPLRRQADLGLLAFTSAGVFERRSDMVNGLRSVLQLSDAEIDQLFIEASAVSV